MGDATTLRTQKELQQFTGMISPSLNFLVLQDFYKKILCQQPLFKERNEVVDYLLYKVMLLYNAPEQIFVKEGDTNNTFVYLSGGGVSQVLKTMHSKREIIVGELKEGHLMGYKSALFNRAPRETYRSKQYSQLAVLSSPDFKEMCQTFKEIHASLLHFVINNPYDYELSFFISVCRLRIPLLADLSDATLRTIFYNGDV